MASVEVFDEAFSMYEVDQREPGDNTVVMLIDLKRCIGCFACETACKLEHDLSMGPRLIRVIQVGPRKVLGRVKTLYIPMLCYHCSPAPCVEACPTGAMQKRAKDGIVFVDSEACIGCKRCMQACPYGAPQYDSRTGRVVKCNFCMQRVDYRRTYTRDELQKIYRYTYKHGGEVRIPVADEVGNIKRDNKGRLVDEKGEPLSGKRLAEVGRGVESITYEGLWSACATKCSTEAMTFGYYKDVKKVIEKKAENRRIIRVGSVYYALPGDDFPEPAPEERH